MIEGLCIDTTYNSSLLLAPYGTKRQNKKQVHFFISENCAAILRLSTDFLTIKVSLYKHMNNLVLIPQVETIF